MGGGGEGEGGGIIFCAVAAAMSSIEHASMANNRLTMPKRRRTRPNRAAFGVSSPLLLVSVNDFGLHAPIGVRRMLFFFF
eukprot:1087994-Prymnesium_polylepis.1